MQKWSFDTILCIMIFNLPSLDEYFYKKSQVKIKSIESRCTTIKSTEEFH